MSIAIRLEPDPHFPRHDVSENNAMFLELMLANAGIIAAGHTNAEKVSWVYGPTDVTRSKIGTWSGNATVNFNFSTGTITSTVGSLNDC